MIMVYYTNRDNKIYEYLYEHIIDVLVKIIIGYNDTIFGKYIFSK